MELTLENFYEQTGRRFRVTREQQARINTKEISREQAFQEFIKSGAYERTKERGQAISPQVLIDPDLTVENFREKTGKRFRRTKDQISRNITPREALQEIVNNARSTLETVEEKQHV